MSIKKYVDFVNEMQSPIKNSTNVPRYDYKNIADILGDKYHISTSPQKIIEFEDIVSKMDNEKKPQTDEYYAKVYKEYKRNKSNKTPPYSDDIIDNNDFGAVSYEDDVKMDEDVAVASNGSGMGAVVTAQPSATPGQTLGGNNVGDTYGNGGTVGSGDIGVGLNRNIRKRPEKSRRKKKAQAQVKDMVKKMGNNIKNTFKESDYKKGGGKKANLMSFSTFSKM